MKHPPYHLKPNKAVDRFLLIDVLRLLSRKRDLQNYTYYGFGGPFLEDCRIINEFFPDIHLVSFEQNSETHKRQEFHRLTKNVELRMSNFGSFLNEFDSSGNEVFWLDYTSLRPEWLNDFSSIINMAETGTVIKISLSAQWNYSPLLAQSILTETELESKMDQYIESFEDKFRNYLPKQLKSHDFEARNFPTTVQSMLQMAAENALRASTGRTFQVISTATYADDSPMLSVTGIVASVEDSDLIENCFKGWTFANFSWDPPKRIQLPVLSMKERLKLERLLPVKQNTGKALARALGYRIDKGGRNIESLRQYATFHAYYPHYAKVTP